MINQKQACFGALAVIVTLVLSGLALPSTVLGSNSNQQATPTFAPTAADTQEPGQESLQAALARAENFSGANEDWEPFTHEFDGVAMVLVPAGCFIMGSTPQQLDVAYHQCVDEQGAENCGLIGFGWERFPHEVCIGRPLWIDRTEVTNAQFAAFHGESSSPSYWSDEERPREQITWIEAQAFCEKRNARLPTDAEWEYAARGPDEWIYPWGNQWDASKVIGNYNGSEGTSPVGSKPDGASWVGALDMSGNVYEWVADWLAEYSTEPQADPTGPISGDYRVLRGGSFYNVLEFFRSAHRDGWIPDDGTSTFGFRCARSR